MFDKYLQFNIKGILINIKKEEGAWILIFYKCAHLHLFEYFNKVD